MELPLKVRIGYKDIEVKFQDSVLIDGQDHWGTFNYGEGQLLIKDSLCNEDTAEVFLHELLHGAFKMGGLRHRYNREEEEQIVSCFSDQLATIFKNNPTVLDTLKKGLK